MANREDMAFHLEETWDILATVTDAARQPVTNIAQAEWRLASPTARLVKATLGEGIEVAGPGALLIRIPSAMQTGIVRGSYDHELWILDGTTGVDSIQVVGTVAVLDSLKRRFP